MGARDGWPEVTCFSMGRTHRICSAGCGCCPSYWVSIASLLLQPIPFLVCLFSIFRPCATSNATHVHLFLRKRRAGTQYSVYTLVYVSQITDSDLTWTQLSSMWQILKFACSCDRRCHRSRTLGESFGYWMSPQVAQQRAWRRAQSEPRRCESTRCLCGVWSHPGLGY